MTFLGPVNDSFVVKPSQAVGFVLHLCGGSIKIMSPTLLFRHSSIVFSVD